MKIYTSRYSNKDLATADAHIVGITLYPPRFTLKFKLEENIGQLAPQKSYFKTADKALFRRRYLEQMEKLGEDGVQALLNPYTGDGRDIILLCYEDVTCDDPEKNWCHRQLLAEWLKDRLGWDVEEYPDSGNWKAKHADKPKFDQMQLF